jgi:hypothetical protein
MPLLSERQQSITTGGLGRECPRHDCEFPTVLLIDPLVLDRKLDRWHRGLRKLTAGCQHSIVPVDGAYGDTEDALAAARVTRRMAVLCSAELLDRTAGPAKANRQSGSARRLTSSRRT